VSHQVESGGMTQDKAFQALHTPDSDDILYGFADAFGSGLEALSNFRTGSPSYFCTDSRTPLGSGLEALSNFRTDSPSESALGVRTLRFGSPFQLSDGLSLLFLYGFADASGSGFGSSFRLSDGLSLRIGTWGKDDEDNSSNDAFGRALQTIPILCLSPPDLCLTPNQN
jgi:hypothetical protein